MNWVRLIVQDLRRGLFRYRYLVVPIIFVLPCCLCKRELDGAGLTGTMMDYFMYCFKGDKPIDLGEIMQEVQLPTLWLLVVGGCLYLNLDYLAKDLTNAGQQVIIRSKHKSYWFLAKCVWNLCSCMVYFLLGGATVFLFTLLVGGEVSLQNNPAATLVIFEGICLEPAALSIAQSIILAFLLPFITVSALSMLQMGLCILVKPVISFLICILILILSFFWASPVALGNGAMIIRSILIRTGEISLVQVVGVGLATTFASALIGSHYFKQSDIIGLEE